MPLVTYTTEDGFTQIREVPHHTAYDDYHKGVLVGPPDLSVTELSYDLCRQLNNLLVKAEWLDYEDISGNRANLLRLIQDQLDTDVKTARELRNKVVMAYQYAYYDINLGERE